jgi:hypothetical protein
VVSADQFALRRATADEEMIPAGLDLSLGRLYGFPYCMGVSDAMEQRARAVAEAEEREYQGRKLRERLRNGLGFLGEKWGRR